MKKSRLLDGWSLAALATHGTLAPEQMRRLSDQCADLEWIPVRRLGQVADVLLDAGRIADPRRLDKAREALWISEKDWVYRCAFRAAEPSGDAAFLRCRGLDAVADVYLNGERVAEHRDMYLELRADVTGRLRPENVLLVHFHSPQAWLAAQPWDAHWDGNVHRNRLLRKPHEDFNSFNGAFPYFTPIGIYGDVVLETPDKAELGDLDLDCELGEGYGRADVRVRCPVLSVRGGNPEVRIVVLDPDDQEIASTMRDAPCRTDSAGRQPLDFDLSLRVPSPRLWWPLGYGGQPLYTVVAELRVDGEVVDRLAKRIGFRDVRMGDDFDLTCNGVHVKLWGANLGPLEQFTHVWPKTRVRRLVDLAVNAHCVALRFWGPGAPYGDDLYEACDRAGILVWSEFHHTWGAYPDRPEFLAQCTAEAEAHVRRYKHHPCVFLWCGGNEVHLGVDLTRPGTPVLGSELYYARYAAVCRRLDPRRHYHVDSPIGGAFPNDPLVGDTHGYTHLWFVRGCDYPVMITENARWSPPMLATLRQYIPDAAQFWPDGFASRIRHRRPPQPPSPETAQTSAVQGNDGAILWRDIHADGLLPPAWQLLGKHGNVTNGRAGPIGDFYDTGDTPEGLVYRLGSAHGEFIRRDVERFRRGNVARDAGNPRRTMGHFWWRLNGAWPQIDSEVVDYLLEPKMAYYALARAYAPVLLSFEFGDHIHLWLTNDSAAVASGTVIFQSLPMDGQAPVFETKRHVDVAPGESWVVLSLDEAGMFKRDLVLYARLVDDAGRVLARVNDFADVERNLVFPDAALVLEQTEPDRFSVATDRFARCVHLSGYAAGEADPNAPGSDFSAPDFALQPDAWRSFGWDFSDNDFDLAPGETREVRLLGRHRVGTLEAKGWWCSRAAGLVLDPGRFPQSEIRPDGKVAVSAGIGPVHRYASKTAVAPSKLGL